MALVMLKIGAPGTFHRSVRDESGAVLKVLEFTHGKPIELVGIDLAAVQRDIGGALELVTTDERGRQRIAKGPIEEAEPVRRGVRRKRREAAEVNG